jgi:simple sugar transport system permease protein
MSSGLLALVIFLMIAGFDPIASLAALWMGGFGSTDAIFSATLVRATPLLLLGVAFAVAGRAGALNIGMEGQLALGAISATWVGLALTTMPSPVALPLTLLAGLVGGCLWMVIPVVLRLRFGVTEVIATLLLNFVAEATVSWCVSGPLQEASGTYPQSDPITATAQLPIIVTGTRTHAGLVIALLLAVGMWIAFRKSRWGFQLRAIGAGQLAARITGRVPVERVLGGALLLSGALAGLAGAIEVSGVSHALYQNISPGYGFTAIAVALLARLHPGGMVVTALLFGGLQAGAGAMQRDAGVPAVAVQVVQAVVIIAMLLGTRQRR